MPGLSRLPLPLGVRGRFPYIFQRFRLPAPSPARLKQVGCAATPLRDRIILTIQGPDVGDRERLAEQARKNRLAAEFLPPDYKTQPSHLIARYDLLCILSRYDGFGLTALEAMVAGRVMLVSEEAASQPTCAQAAAG